VSFPLYPGSAKSQITTNNIGTTVTILSNDRIRSVPVSATQLRPIRGFRAMKTLLLTTNLLLGLVGFSYCASAATPWPLGAFPDEPEDSGSQTNLESFDTLMGAKAIILNDYIDFTQAPSDWQSNNSYTASEFQQTAGWTNVIPMIALPMGSTNSSAPSTSQILTNYSNGTYDSMLQAMVQTWKNDGYSTQYWRPGVEMNLTSTPGFVGGDPGLQAQWIAAFQHIYTTMHAAANADGVTLYIVWNPGLVNGTPAGNATQTLWPGKQYVDIIGGDIYGEVTPDSLYDWAANGQVYNARNAVYDSSLAQFASNPINLYHFYSYPASTATTPDSSGGVALSLPGLIAFAEAQGLPVGLPETGAGGSGAEIRAGLTDNATFPAWEASVLKTSTVPVAFVSIWDDNGGGRYAFTPVTSAGKPNEAAAWAANFGAGAPSGSSQPASLNNTQVNGAR
jgi:hypothetical protein